MQRAHLIFIALILISFCSKAATSKLMAHQQHFLHPAPVDFPENEEEIDSSLDFKIKVKLTPYIPNYKDLGFNGRALIFNRLNSILSQFEDCNENGNPRFIIGTTINLVNKKVISGNPLRFSNTYELTFTSADIVSKTIFATYTTTIKGLEPGRFTCKNLPERI
jgi:hypothetical protein